MNDAAKKWVAALRSGEYRQAEGALHEQTSDGDFYCCLGVACKLYNEQFPGELEIEKLGQEFSYDGTTGVLPPKVRYWLNLRWKDGTWNEDKSLASENDNGLNFDEIADIIEREPKGLFDERRS